jgi:hypothetical protein
MQINNRNLELELENKALKEEKSQIELELNSKTNLLEKYKEVKGSDNAWQHPQLRTELERLNLEFSHSVEEELNVKQKKAQKTILSLKEIIDQKNSEIEKKEIDIDHLQKKYEEIQIFYEEKLRHASQELEEKDRN